MGIYIKNMDMPTNRNELYIIIKSDGTIFDQFGPYFTVIAINIPPHDRLIDVDVVIKFLKAKANNPLNHKSAPVSWAFAYKYLADLLGDMPTIIPEDRG